MSSLFRPHGTLTAGPDPVAVTSADAGWTYSGLHVVALDLGEERHLDLEGLEAAVVPLRGGCTVDAGAAGMFELAGRSDVFDALTDLCYLPLDSSVAIASAGGGLFAVATARATERRDAFALTADQTSVDTRGAGAATRQINGVLSADVPGPQRLIVVEVLTPAGNWSSYPPHKHDEWTDTEVPVEEIYYFRMRDRDEDRRDGLGMHRTYTVDGEIDETVEVRTGDVFLIPRGYHGPCVAAPGYDMYYLNVMAGPDPERRWMICTDPRYAWLWDEWTGESTDPRIPMYTAIDHQ